MHGLCPQRAVHPISSMCARHELRPFVETPCLALQPGSRFIVASDGMWDVIKTPEAYKMVKNLSATKAASKLAQVAAKPRVLDDSR